MNALGRRDHGFAVLLHFRQNGLAQFAVVFSPGIDGREIFFGGLGRPIDPALIIGRQGYLPQGRIEFGKLLDLEIQVFPIVEVALDDVGLLAEPGAEGLLGYTGYDEHGFDDLFKNSLLGQGIIVNHLTDRVARPVHGLQEIGQGDTLGVALVLPDPRFKGFGVILRRLAGVGDLLFFGLVRVQLFQGVVRAQETGDIALDGRECHLFMVEHVGFFVQPHVQRPGIDVVDNRQGGARLLERNSTFFVFSKAAASSPTISPF